MTLTDSLARAFFNRHPHAVLILDADGRVLHANAAAGWLEREGHTPGFAELTGLVGLPNALHDAHGLGAGWTRRLRVRSGDNAWRQVDVDLVAADQDQDNASHYFCVLRDVTGAVEVAHQQQESSVRFRITTESAPVLVWMADSGMRCDWFNKSWLDFRGRPLGAEIGDGWTEGLHPEDVENCLGVYEAGFEARAPFTLDCRLRRADGVFRWMLNTGMPRHGRDGEFLGYVGSCVDITERRELEDKLAERMRVLRFADRRREAFLAKLSHELRNPLAPIANAAGILKSLEPGNQQLSVVREILERQVAQLRRLITDLADVTKITAGKVVLQREVVSIDALIDHALDVVRPEADARHQTLRLGPLRPGLSCIGDPDRLRQALSALLDNAIKFSPEGAAIDVSVAASDDDMLAIAIQDRGAGIAPDVLPTIFDLFVQGRPSSGGEKSGLGVGLTIAKKLAQLHGGDVSLESAGLGLGTLATLRIHREAMDEGRAGAIDGSELRSVTGSRVLIIEDNDDARESLRMLVELGDNEVRTAANATQALRIAETFEPHLVVCDLGLPDRDGYEVVEALRARFAGRDIRYVALTGFGGAEDRDRAMDSGFDSFVVKPLQSSPP